MTGTELSAALAEKLKMLLPDCAVRPAFTGTLQRLPQRAAVTVGVMQEENADGVFETVLGVQLYARERDDHARLFDAVCAAVSSLPCALRSVKRSETTYSAALSCLVTLCTVQAATGAADNARAAVMIGDKVFTADAVKISHEAKVKRYYAIGEENPYAAVAGKAVYTIVLHGFSGGEEALPGEFTLQTGGARYTHCVLKAASENKLVIEAGACEKNHTANTKRNGGIRWKKKTKTHRRSPKFWSARSGDIPRCFVRTGGLHEPDDDAVWQLCVSGEPDGIKTRAGVPAA